MGIWLPCLAQMRIIIIMIIAMIIRAVRFWGCNNVWYIIKRAEIDNEKQEKQ